LAKLQKKRRRENRIEKERDSSETTLGTCKKNMM
jgi:hypothetical protein